jgi:YVTN family beta-propeller protein
MVKRTLGCLMLCVSLVSSGYGNSTAFGAGTETGGAPSTTPTDAIAYDALFVANGGGNSISVINAETNEVAGTIAVKNASFPHHLNLSPDKAFLAVAAPGTDLSDGHEGDGGGEGRGAILRLDARNGGTRVARRLNRPNHNGIFSPDGREIWTSQMTMSGVVLVLDAATLATTHAIKVGDMPAEVTFSRDGRYAFVANGMSNTVTVMDAASKAVETTIAVGRNPVGAWPGNDGMMYVDNESDKTLTAIDATSLNVVRTYNLGFTPGMAATARNGELWVTDVEHGKVVFYSATAGTKLGEVATAGGAHSIAFSADGTTGYISNQGAGSVSVIDIATRSVRKTIVVGAKPNGMVFRSKS